MMDGTLLRHKSGPTASVIKYSNLGLVDQLWCLSPVKYMYMAEGIWLNMAWEKDPYQICGQWRPDQCAHSYSLIRVYITYTIIECCRIFLWKHWSGYGLWKLIQAFSLYMMQAYLQMKASFHIIFFLFLHEYIHVCCEYLSEAPLWGASNEYPKN